MYRVYFIFSKPKTRNVWENKNKCHGFEIIFFTYIYIELIEIMLILMKFKILSFNTIRTNKHGQFRNSIFQIYVHWIDWNCVDFKFKILAFNIIQENKSAW